jgi:hypothetical protein
MLTRTERFKLDRSITVAPEGFRSRVNRLHETEDGALIVTSALAADELTGQVLAWLADTTRAILVIEDGDPKSILNRFPESAIRVPLEQLGTDIGTDHQRMFVRRFETASYDVFQIIVHSGRVPALTAILKSQFTLIQTDDPVQVPDLIAAVTTPAV